jgi:flavodoxin
MEKPKKVLVVYFSGTGGVKRIANGFEEILMKRNIEVIKHSMDASEFNNYKDQYNQIVNEVNLIVVLYPVYAFGAPRPVTSVPKLPLIS